MKKLCVILLALCLLLCACGETAPEPSAAPTPAPPPAPTEKPFVDVGGTEVGVNTASLDLSDAPFELDALLAAAPRLAALTEIELGVTALTAEEVAMLRAAFPQATLRYRVSLFGEAYDPEIESLALPDMDPADSAALAAVLPLFPALREIDFVSEDGACAYTLEDIPELDKLRAAAPGVHLRLSFELFGQTVSSEDARIEYVCVPIGNEGAETVRAVLPYLQSCEYLLLDGCGIDNEILAQLRDDFPDTKIVWRVWITDIPYYGNERLMRTAGFLTDTKRIRTVHATDWTSGVLKYCIETKYVDFGHSEYVSNIDFLGSMPELEEAVVALTEITDVSPLANCPNLKYLEVFSTGVTDLSPLANCKNLQYLNISNLPGLTDITPLYELTNLKVLRMVVTPNVPQEQKDELARRLPDCLILSEGYDPTLNGWRFDDDGNITPWYKDLREHMEYDIDYTVYGIP